MKFSLILIFHLLNLVRYIKNMYDVKFPRDHSNQKWLLAEGWPLDTFENLCWESVKTHPWTENCSRIQNQTYTSSPVNYCTKRAVFGLFHGISKTLCNPENDHFFTKRLRNFEKSRIYRPAHAVNQIIRVDDAQSDNNGVEGQTIKSTFRNKSIKGLSDRRPRRVSDLFAPDSTPKWCVLALRLDRQPYRSTQTTFERYSTGPE